MPLKILVVDDHQAARSGLISLFKGTTIEVTETAADGEEALQKLEPGRVDVALVDVQMKKMDGLMLLSSIRDTSPSLPVVLISAYDYPVYMARAVAIGAQDFVLKNDPIESIELSIRHAAEKLNIRPGGRLDTIRRKMSEPLDSTILPPELPVTAREGQVLRHVAFGLSNREIASSLGISVETVKEHVQNILRKTGASDRTDVAVRAVRLGIVD